MHVRVSRNIVKLRHARHVWKLMIKFKCRCSISDTVFVVMESQRPYSEWVEITDEINHTHYKNSFQSLQLVPFYFTLFCLVYFILSPQDELL